MRHASGHNYRNRLVIVDLAVGQIPPSTERISSNKYEQVTQLLLQGVSVLAKSGRR